MFLVFKLLIIVLSFLTFIHNVLTTNTETSNNTWPNTLVVGTILGDNQFRTKVIMEAALREAELKLKLNGYIPADLNVKYKLNEIKRI